MPAPRTIHPLDWLAIPRPKPRWHVEGLLPEGGWVMMVAEAKRGKSRLLQQMGHAIANGAPFMGLPTAAGRVLYLDLDEPEGDILDRLSDFQAAEIDMRGPLHYAHPEDLMKPLNLLMVPAQEWARDVTDAFDPDVVIIDSLREVHTGDENDSGDAVRIAHTFQRCFGTRTLVLIHHARKLSVDAQGVPDPRSFGRGSNYWGGRVSAMWMLFRTGETTHWYVEPRSGERERHELKMVDGVWTFPELERRLTRARELLALCAEHPEATHVTVWKLAAAKWGYSRRTCYRLLDMARAAGLRCVHG